MRTHTARLFVPDQSLHIPVYTADFPIPKGIFVQLIVVELFIFTNIMTHLNQLIHFFGNYINNTILN